VAKPSSKGRRRSAALVVVGVPPAVAVALGAAVEEGDEQADP